MTIKEILIWPDNRLLQKSTEVTNFKEAELIAADMYDTLMATKGLGLAAIQIGISKRILLMQDEENNTIVLINPILESGEDLAPFENEGCLSLPGELFNTMRFTKVRVRYYCLNTSSIETTTFNGLPAVEFQHELDHLDGTLLILRPEVGLVKRDIIRRRLIKYKRAKQRVTL